MKYITIEIISRNVIMSKSSEDLLNDLAKKAGNKEVVKFINSNLRNWLINNYEGKLHNIKKPHDPFWVDKALKNGDKIYDLDFSKEKSTFMHWIDYLNTINPNKVSHISVPQLKEKVKIWEKALEKNLGNSSLNEDGIRIIGSDKDYTWVEVFGKESLKREGDNMGHCVGGEGYQRDVDKGITKIYSLRDKNNMPHVTIEYNVPDKILVQIKGKSNKPPVDKYRDIIINFIRKLDINEAYEEDLINLDLYIDTEDEDSNDKIIDLRKDKHLLLAGNFEYTPQGNDKKKELNLKTLGASQVALQNVDIKADDITAMYVVVNDSAMSVKQISFEEEASIMDSRFDTDVTFNGGHELSLSNVFTMHKVSIECDKVEFEKCGVIRIGDSKIESLSKSTFGNQSDDGTSLHFLDNVFVNDLALDDDLSVECFGKNNTFGSLDISEDSISDLPDGFKAHELTVDLGYLPKKIASNVKVDILICDYISDINDEDEKELTEIAETLKKFNAKKIVVIAKELSHSDDFSNFMKSKGVKNLEVRAN